MNAPDSAVPPSPDGGAPPARAAWPRRPQRLAIAVVAELVDRIVGAEYPEGRALPVEGVLCDMFAVSRTVIREAVKSLEAMRLVTVQQGHGTRVRRFEEWDLLDPVVLAATVRHDAELSILDDLIDVRRSLEAQMSGQAAARATTAQMAGIETAMAKLYDEVTNPTSYLQADLDFHDTIMAASGNRLGRAIIHTMNAEAFRSLRYVGVPTRQDCEDSNIAHQVVCDRLVARDADGAAKAMDDHILASWLKRRPAGRARS
jgi:GntR family galactonate operon transcriptional repressor